MRYMLEAPQNCDSSGVVFPGKIYPAELATDCPPNKKGRHFYFTAYGRRYFTLEFNSHHLGGGSWIVHEEEEGE